MRTEFIFVHTDAVEECNEKINSFNFSGNFGRLRGAK